MSRELQHEIYKAVGGEQPWPLFVTGESGSGKTCAALCMIDRWGGDYYEAADLVNDVMDSRFRRLHDPVVNGLGGLLVSEREFWRRWAARNLTVLDELGSRSQITDAHYEIVKRAIDRREGKPSVVISNVSLDGIAETYGDPIASRLSAGTVIVLAGDRRIRRAEDRAS